MDKFIITPFSSIKHHFSIYVCINDHYIAKQNNIKNNNFKIHFLTSLLSHYTFEAFI